MASTPQLKVYDDDGEYVAACKRYEDAACLVASYGVGAMVKYGHRIVLWTEGAEEISAAESYDRARDIMRGRLEAAYAARPM